MLSLVLCNYFITTSLMIIIIIINTCLIIMCSIFISYQRFVVHYDISALMTANFQEKEHGYLILEYLKNIKQPGMPLMVMEFWSGWFDHWGEKHHVWPLQGLLFSQLYYMYMSSSAATLNGDLCDVFELSAATGYISCTRFEIPFLVHPQLHKF